MNSKLGAPDSTLKLASDKRGTSNPVPDFESLKFLIFTGGIIISG
jgi:hypothetical protein